MKVVKKNDSLGVFLTIMVKKKRLQKENLVDVIVKCYYRR